MFAQHVVITDVAIGFFAMPTEILRVGTDDGTLIHLVVLAHASTVYDARVRHDFATVANLYISVDECERMHYNVFAKLRRRIDMCQRTNISSHNQYNLRLLSTATERLIAPARAWSHNMSDVCELSRFCCAVSTSRYVVD